MHFFYFLILLSFAACKSENQIPGKPATPYQALRNYTEKMKDSPKLVLPHTPMGSILRNKLITNLIEANMKTNKLTTILKEDEFKLLDQQDAEPTNLERFKSGSNEAKVIVSYSQALNAYLVPAGLPLKELETHLKIQNEDNRELLWITEKEGLTKAGQVIFLVSVNHEDLMEFDRHLYSEKIEKLNIEGDLILNLQFGQEAEIKMQTDYYKQALHPQKFAGATSRCKPQDYEAGTCEPCSFDRQVPSSYSQQKSVNFNDLNLTVKMGDKKFSINSLSPIYEHERNLMILKINASTFTDEDSIDLRFTMNPKSFQVLTQGYNYSDKCLLRNISQNEILQTKAINHFVIEIKGRGALLKSIKL